MRRWLRAVPIVLLVASFTSLFTFRGAETVPLYAARTGNMCQQCHFDPNGGGPRNAFGFSFARNRHSLDADTTGAWKDLDLTNQVGEKFPLFISVNQRLMLLANETTNKDSLDRLGFFNMESEIHFAFQPHSQLTLVYSRDAFAASPSGGTDQTKDAFGMISGLAWDSYLKLGRFRNPFGLRMDDHTVATRNSFLDFSTQQSFLPYDPRNPDMGVEYGLVRGGLYGRIALTNGEANVFAGDFAETKSIKIGHNLPWWQSGLSFYDTYHKTPVPTDPARKRATRWGYYGLTHRGPFAAMGELAAGTDEAEPTNGLASGPKTNLLAFFGELDYAPRRDVNFRFRYDRLEMDRSSNSVVREENTHDRYALEGEWVPVPFAELRWTLRRINHKAEDIGGVPSPDENQAYIQAHFSY